MTTQKLRGIIFGLIFMGMTFKSPARIILVNTTNNVSPGSGETNLVQALQLAQDGDAIHFNIPGTGPFYLATPPRLPDDGYPPITNNNITIDGYTQPGAFANTNTILGSNTARIQIVLDSRAGGMCVEDIPGYTTADGPKEGSVLLVYGATNVTIRGLDFLGPGTGSSTLDDPATYAISFASAMYGHVNGCWFGVAPDRTNVFRFQDAVTGFQGDDFSDGTVVGVEKNAPDTATARSQFNVIVGEYIPIILEGDNFRISGNFINVFPDGLTDFNISDDHATDHTLQAFIEIGQSGDNVIIGTDGDGHNDAEERNLFGGVIYCDDGYQLEWYDCTSSNNVIAGNYFGVGVDGLTRFTNAMTLLGNLSPSATLRLGSDFDGVSDALEGNVISLNYPFEALYPSPATGIPSDFSVVQSGAAISFRGNTLMGAELMPFTYANGFGTDLSPFAQYYTNYISEPIFPTVSPNSTQILLKGTIPPGVPPFTNVIIDVYLADDEAWTNGQQFQFPELAYTDPVTSQTEYYGFAEGNTWLASFNPHSAANLDPTPGQFAFDLSALNLPAGKLVTVAASYSAQPPGTHNAVMQTSPFALPIIPQIVPHLSISVSSGYISLAWPTNAGAFDILASPTLAPPAWVALNPEPVLLISGTNYHATFSWSGQTGFFRLSR